MKKAWDKITKENSNKVKKKELLEFLLSIMNYENPGTSYETQNIHINFISFYENRHICVLQQRERKRKQDRELSNTPSQMSIITAGDLTKSFRKNLDIDKEKLQDK